MPVLVRPEREWANSEEQGLRSVLRAGQPTLVKEEVMRFRFRPGLFSLFVIGCASAVPAAEMSEEEAIRNALSAAPEAVAKHAAVMLFGKNMEMKTVKQGTNGFTCMPDNPQSPGNDPMCLDKNGMEWAHAWMTNGQPSAGKVGFAYMLMGGSDASNTDPHAAAPAAGGVWVDTGPHVMILNAKDSMAGYPRQGENLDTSQPYVMWPDTPYEHLMIPVK